MLVKVTCDGRMVTYCVDLRSRDRSINDFSAVDFDHLPLTMCIIGAASITTKLATSSTSAMRPIGIDDGASLLDGCAHTPPWGESLRRGRTAICGERFCRIVSH
jgi:hypothetical protein